VEEIVPYHLKRVTILRIIVIVKLSECVDVPLVYVFEAPFVPIGGGACAISPLVDATLYLITVGARLVCKTLGHVIEPYHREYESHGSDRHWGEMFLESHAVVILILEP
jgi:hypothetical protein